MSKAFDDVKAERDRQVSVEGWTIDHDDRHTKSEMALAAACYAIQATTPDAKIHPAAYMDDAPPGPWPWSQEWWKPKTPRRDLVRAAALLIAEIERIDRAEDQ